MITETLPAELVNAPAWAIDTYHQLPPLCGYTDLARVTGMSKGGVANLHSEGNAPANGFLMGRRRVYPRADAVAWLISFAESKAAKAKA